MRGTVSQFLKVKQGLCHVRLEHPPPGEGVDHLAGQARWCGRLQCVVRLGQRSRDLLLSTEHRRSRIPPRLNTKVGEAPGGLAHVVGLLPLGVQGPARLGAGVGGLLL